MNCLKLAVLTCLLVLVCSPVVTYGQNNPSSFKTKTITPSGNGQAKLFPVSVWYSGGKARAPMLSTITSKSKQQWLDDLKQIKSLGFRMVRTWVSWSAVEPKAGQYHFDNLRLLMRLAKQVGLKVFIQMYDDSAPEWVGKKYGKDALFRTQSGDKIIPQAAPGYSLDNPGVRKSIATFFRKPAQVAIQYPNFYGWDVWSEPHIINWVIIPWKKNAQYGFNPYTQKRFRKWLKHKYRTLDRLNKAWGRTYLNWKDVTAPRFSTILSYTDFIDWKLFLYHKIASDLRMKYNAIRSVDSNHVITAHASPPSLFSSPLNGKDAANDFQRAKQLDYYGLSVYPKHGDHETNWPTWLLEAELDFSYSANEQHGGFYVGELQSGQGTVGLSIGDPVTSGDIREWAWTAVASGAKALNFYAYYPMSSGYESGGYGLINLNGTLTQRSKTAGKIAKIIHKNDRVFVHSVPVKPEIALVYNPLAQMIGGYENIGKSTGRLHTDALVGYYRFFAKNNIPVDFIDRRDLAKSDLSRYKLIIVPYSLIFTERAAQGLKKYVAQGGHVVGDARMAWNNIQGYASRNIPGMGLSKLFGVREAKIKKRKEVTIDIADTGSVLTSGLEGKHLIGTFFAESLQRLPDSQHKVQVLATFADGAPAIASSRYGKGATLFIGSFLGLANQTLPDAHRNNDSFFRNLIDWANVQLPLNAASAGKNGVQVRLQKNRKADTYLLFIINHTKTEKSVSFDLNADHLNLNPTDKTSFTELNGNRAFQETPSSHQLPIHATLHQKGVEVWRIQQTK
jgi:beta-galactosidase